MNKENIPRMQGSIGDNSPNAKFDAYKKTSPAKFSIHMAVPGSNAYF